MGPPYPNVAINASLVPVDYPNRVSNGVSQAAVSTPASKPMILEDDLGYHDSTFGKVDLSTGKTTMNQCFADGHAKYITLSAVGHLCKTYYAQNDGSRPVLPYGLTCPQP